MKEITKQAYRTPEATVLTLKPENAILTVSDISGIPDPLIPEDLF